jgi:hypothetical protein
VWSFASAPSIRLHTTALSHSGTFTFSVPMKVHVMALAALRPALSTREVKASSPVSVSDLTWLAPVRHLQVIRSNMCVYESSL